MKYNYITKVKKYIDIDIKITKIQVLKRFFAEYKIFTGIALLFFIFSIFYSKSGILVLLIYAGTIFLKLARENWHIKIDNSEVNIEGFLKKYNFDITNMLTIRTGVEIKDSYQSVIDNELKYRQGILGFSDEALFSSSLLKKEIRSRYVEISFLYKQKQQFVKLPYEICVRTSRKEKLLQYLPPEDIDKLLNAFITEEQLGTGIDIEMYRDIRTESKENEIQNCIAENKKNKKTMEITTGKNDLVLLIIVLIVFAVILPILAGLSGI